jgi:hypothetical protein
VAGIAAVVAYAPSFLAFWSYKLVFPRRSKHGAQLVSLLSLFPRMGCTHRGLFDLWAWARVPLVHSALNSVHTTPRKVMIRAVVTIAGISTRELVAKDFTLEQRADNIAIACSAIEKAAKELAVTDVDDAFILAYNDRHMHREVCSVLVV